MYNLLMVDDEVHVLEGLKADLDFARLGIANVFEAINVRQAKDVFAAHDIHVLLCDIEMPRGSGLELLEWVNGRRAETVCIFLTSHAEFRYAQRAIQLGSLDYLLKPVAAGELEQAIRKAIREVESRSERNRSAAYRQLINLQQPLVMEKFWLDLLTRAIPSSPASIREYAGRYQLPLEAHMTFIPILVGVKRWHKPLSLREEKIMEYALKNSAGEIIVPADRYGQIFEWKRGQLLAIVSPDPSDTGVIAHLRRACETYIADCNRYFSCDLSCYIGKEVPVHELADEVDRLTTLEHDNVAFENKVFLPGSPVGRPAGSPLPDMSAWASLLRNGTQDVLLQKAACELERLAAGQALNARMMHEFRHDFLQMVYSALHAKGIQAHRLFSDDRSLHLFAEAVRSVKHMEEWMRHVIGRAVEQTDAMDDVLDVVDRVKKYIGHHLDRDDLAREDIAKEVCLHPDYLSRLFKRVTGQSMTDYILQERIHLAKHLLENTDLPVGEVASSVGYHNFSHFTKMFKKCTGFSPKDYRKNGRAKRS